MITPRIRALVSLTALATMAVSGGCVRASSEPSPVEARPLTIRFVNEAKDYVHVYLVGDGRQWLLGRVEPGAIATLRLPDASLDANEGLVQLAVLTGARITQQAALDPRARVTMAQPASAILSQRWRFAQGELTSLGLRGAGADSQGP